MLVTKETDFSPSKYGIGLLVIGTTNYPIEGVISYSGFRLTSRCLVTCLFVTMTTFCCNISQCIFAVNTNWYNVKPP